LLVADRSIALLCCFRILLSIYLPASSITVTFAFLAPGANGSAIAGASSSDHRLSATAGFICSAVTLMNMSFENPAGNR
jgi:hypothetical protein